MSIADLFCVVVPPGGPKIGATTYIKIGSSTHDEPRTLADNPSVLTPASEGAQTIAIREVLGTNYEP